MTRMRASIFSTMAAAGGLYSQGFSFPSIVRTPLAIGEQLFEGHALLFAPARQGDTRAPYYRSRLASSAAIAKEAPIPATQAGHP
jgi:hypothetical protein